MVAVVKIEASDFKRRADQFAALPRKVQDQVLKRGFEKVGRSTLTRIVRETAEGTDLRQKDVRKVTRMVHSAANVHIVMRSGYLPLSKLGAARQTRSGVTVRGWGSHKSAFIVRRYGGNIYTRTTKKRFPIKRLWGPNPAAYVLKHAAKFQAILEEQADRHLLPEIARQMDLLLRL